MAYADMFRETKEFTCPRSRQPVLSWVVSSWVVFWTRVSVGMMRAATPGVLALVLPLLAACGTFGVSGDGESCVRSIECTPGLACVNLVCTTDLSGIMGMPPASQDAGEVDAPLVDAPLSDAPDAVVADVGAVDTGVDGAIPRCGQRRRARRCRRRCGGGRCG